jgi:uncharacterized protein
MVVYIIPKQESTVKENPKTQPRTGRHFPSRDELEMGKIGEVLEDIAKGLPRHLADVYEKVAIETLWRNMDRFSPFIRASRWWEGDQNLDVVALNTEFDSIFFGEVKWTEKPVGVYVCEALPEISGLVIWGNQGGRKCFCLSTR